MKVDKLEDEDTGTLFRMRTKEKGKYFGIPSKHEIVLRGGKQSLKAAKAAPCRVHFLNGFVILRQ